MSLLTAVERVVVNAVAPMRVVVHRSPLGEWETVHGAPDAALRAHVVGDYAGWTEHAPRPIARREVPVAFVPLIINLAAPFEVATPGGAPAAPTRYDSFVAGPHDTHSFVAGTGPSCCMQVNLTPPGAHRLLRLPLDGLANRVVALDDALGSVARALVERLGNAPTWTARFAMLDAFLRERLLAGPPASCAEWVWHRVSATRGRVSVQALLDETGRTPKALVAECRTALGMPPKRVARVARFAHALSHLSPGVRPAWATVAAACGYYDQAHLVREFHALAGCTPGEYAARLLPGGGSAA